MPGKFILKDDVRREELDIVRLGWLSHPASTGASKFTVLEGTFFPGKGHSFHYHADQEELIYVVSGTVEHWIEQESVFSAQATASSCRPTSYMPPSMLVPRTQGLLPFSGPVLATWGSSRSMCPARHPGTD